MKKFSQAPADKSGDAGSRLRHLERLENDKSENGFSMSADLFNMMLEICSADRGDKKSHDPVKIFNWLKSVNAWRVQDNGGVVIDFSGRFHAERAFDFVGDALMGYFKTRLMAATFRGSFVRYLAEPERKRGEYNPRVAEAVKNAAR